ncbi:rrna metabolism sbds family protein [Cystoisospora suis]|uniref:Rrna metabolism sbds family protein n=1 Tax=Cystoisospora suis TaxID=483139 RepID=A0A2C6K2D7_9APIC|nr:rrna metabolism sbds family protein [Cystoisospora suis]
MALKQPVTQVRLTNVAVVRLKQSGFRFEVACYKNKVLNWRSGIETDLQEVLQTNAVFHNVSKGEFAKRDALLTAFKTLDEDKICRIILEKGELQISEKERQTTLAAILQDVITFVIEMTVNVRTGLPLTRTAAASALKQAGFSVKLGVSSKAQALKAVDLLQKRLGPQAIARRMMRLKAECLYRHRDEILSLITKKCGGIIEDESVVEDVGQTQGDEEMEEKDISKEVERPIDRSATHRKSAAQENQTTEKPSSGNHGEGRSSATDLDSSLSSSTTDPDSASTHRHSRRRLYSVTFLSPASCYRELDIKLQSVGGSLFLVSANCCTTAPVDSTYQSHHQQGDSNHPYNEDASSATPSAGLGTSSRDKSSKQGNISGDEEEDREAHDSDDVASGSRRARKGKKKARRNKSSVDKSRGRDTDQEDALKTVEGVKRLSFRELSSNPLSGKKSSAEKRSGVGVDRSDGKVDSLHFGGTDISLNMDGSFEEMAMAWLRRGTQEDTNLLFATPGDFDHMGPTSIQDGRRGHLAPSSAQSAGEARRFRAEKGRRSLVTEQRQSDSDSDGSDPASGWKREVDSDDQSLAAYGAGHKHTHVPVATGNRGKKKEKRRARHTEADVGPFAGERDSSGHVSPTGLRAQEVLGDDQGVNTPGHTASSEASESQAWMGTARETRRSEAAWDSEKTTVGLSKANTGEQRRNGFPCRTCCTLLASAALYRQHCKSSLHASNLKRKVKGLPPLSEEQLKENEIDQHLVCL